MFAERKPLYGRRRLFHIELRGLLKLALPIILMQLCMAALGVEDTLFMGKLGPNYIAAVGLGHALVFCFMIFGFGSLYGVDSLASRAIGAQRFSESVQVYYHSIFVAFIIATICWCAVSLGTSPILRVMKVDPAVVPLLEEYVGIVRWVYFPALLFTATRQYLQSLSKVRLLVSVMVLANVINIVVNYALVFGNWGLPRLEVTGAAFATLAANIVLIGGATIILVGSLKKLEPVVFQWDQKIFGELFRLGIPGGIQAFFEASIFSFVSLLVARFGATALAAHQLTLNLASLTFMIPMGVSYAAAVRVGYGYGALDFAKARAAGTAALTVSLAIMLFTCSAFFIIPEFLLGLYTNDRDVLVVGVQLLFVAGIFQLADGAQVALTGMIRGLGNTKASMVANLISHWAIGLPLGYYLGFTREWGASGLWIGLSVGLGLVALSLYVYWQILLRDLSHAD